MAAEIVNEIGEHFLRDKFKPDAMLQDILSSVDASDLKGENGEFTVDLALKKRTPFGSAKDADEGEPEPQWGELRHGGITRVQSTAWEVQKGDTRTALDRVKRGADRRQIKNPYGGIERRKQNSRRADDSANQQVW